MAKPLVRVVAASVRPGADDVGGAAVAVGAAERAPVAAAAAAAADEESPPPRREAQPRLLVRPVRAGQLRVAHLVARDAPGAVGAGEGRRGAGRGGCCKNAIIQ